MKVSKGATFSPHSTKSRVVCSVLNCDSKAVNNPNLRFHGIPKKNASFVYFLNDSGVLEQIDRSVAWKICVPLKKNISSPNIKICSLHFDKDDYLHIESCKCCYINYKICNNACKFKTCSL